MQFIKACVTTSENPTPKISQSEPCVFPFYYKERVRYGCISEDDPNGQFWCSTKTANTSESEFEHIGGFGHWGHCSKNCIV